MSSRTARIAPTAPAQGDPTGPTPAEAGNTYVDALRKLRAIYVETRRSKVIECLMHDYPSGNERRLAEVQNAIIAIDDAIQDEIGLARPELDAEPTRAKTEIKDAPQSKHVWTSYEEWRSGKRSGPEPRPAEPHSDNAPLIALWRSWGAPAQLTEAQVDEMLKR
jgi:hypothetical protein